MGAALLQLFQHPARRLGVKALAAQATLASKPPKPVAWAGFAAGDDITGPTADGSNRLSGPSASAVSAAGVRCSSNYAGGHAAYLAWFVSVHALPPEDQSVSLLCCCFTGQQPQQAVRSPGEAAAAVTDAQRKAVVRRVFRAGLKFAKFKHLPLSMDHPCVRALCLLLASTLSVLGPRPRPPCTDGAYLFPPVLLH